MNPAEKLWENVSKLDALMSMFELAYLNLIEIGSDRLDDREHSSWAFYMMKELVGEMLNETELLVKNGGKENG